jgi:repressor LexA
VINDEKYEDRNGWRGITDPVELERYIVNIYKTLMTRGMRGCYLYFVDKETEKYFKSRLGQDMHPRGLVKSPITIDMVRVPLVGSAPCGTPLLGQENIEEYIEVEKNRVRPGHTYFILRAIGDSMNLAGINDGDLVLCRQQLKADTGDKVVSLLGDNVTIKIYDKEGGRRILRPKSTNKSHQPITPEEGDTVQGVVQEVLKIEE